MSSNPPAEGAFRLRKAPTGIVGLDEITNGGLPAGRPTLICGSAGTGKTMLATEFLVRGATEFDEPGVLMTFEETTRELGDNVHAVDSVGAKRVVLRGMTAIITGERGLSVFPITSPRLQIFAVPTLVRRLPQPIKKIIGDLSDEARVLVGLDIQPVSC